MKYLWTEDTGAGLHFWQLVNKLLFNEELNVESKGSNQGILDAISQISIKEDDTYYIAFDYVTDNQDVRNKYRLLRSFASRFDKHIVILDMICFEYLILSFDRLIEWTGTGKKDKIKMREDILNAMSGHNVDLSKIQDKKTLQYMYGFKRISTERIMKALINELTENEMWSVNGDHMGECWYKDCCVSVHQDNLRCGNPDIKTGEEKMLILIKSAEVLRVLTDITKEVKICEQQ